MSHYILTLILLSLYIIALGVESAEFPCSKIPEHVHDDNGTLVISRNDTSCGFIAQDGAKFFAFDTSQIVLRDDESIEVSSKLKQNIATLRSPLEPGFVVIGAEEPTITFNLNAIKGDPMIADFFENKPVIPVDGDRFNNIRLVPLQISEVSLNFKKTLKSPVHLEILNSKGEFSHSLIENANNIVPVQFDGSKTVTIKSSPVLDKCSKSYTLKSDQSQEIAGPDLKDVDTHYKCVNIFSTTAGAHFEVDFSNFLDLTDSSDKLLLDDGVSRIEITKNVAESYEKKVLTFKASQLAVVYWSPLIRNRTNVQYKLAISSKTTGGVFDAAADLKIATGGQSRFVLRPQENQYATLVTSGKQLGGNLTIIDGDKSLTINEKSLLPPVIAHGRLGAELTVNTAVKSKVTATLSYKPSSVDCNGILFEPNGVITIQGGPKTCYWLLGAARSRLTFNYYNIPMGSVEIYRLEDANPIFNRTDLSASSYIPPIVIGQAYLKVSTSANYSRLDASVSPVTEFQASTSFKLNQDLQKNITSVGYPTSYVWSMRNETITLKTNVTGVISVADRDVRKGESIFVNQYDIMTRSSDVVFKNSTTITILKTTSRDFELHRGYKFVFTEFQRVITADTTKSPLSITKPNVTSLLVIISAPQLKRIAFNLTTKTEDTQLSVIDSATILGQTVTPLNSNKTTIQGDTTSDTLSISFRSAKALSDISIDVKTIDCNKTVDHICDGSTRCVPAVKLCTGVGYCKDGSDLRINCTGSGGPAPNPEIIEKGVSGFAVFLLCMIMFALGSVAALYGPDVYKNLETRVRSGQYTTFTSTE